MKEHFCAEKTASAKALQARERDWSQEDKEAKGRKQVREVAGSWLKLQGFTDHRQDPGLCLQLRWGSRGFWEEGWPL